MRKIISIIMIMFVTIGVVPASASPKTNEELKTKIEKNLSDDILYNSVVKKIANYYQVPNDKFFQYGSKFKEIIDTLSAGNDNVLLRFVEGNVVILCPDSTLLGEVTGKSYKPVFNGTTLTELQLIGDFVDNGDLDTRLNYGILRITKLGAETVNYKGSFYGGNSKGDFYASSKVEPSMTLTFESGKLYELDKANTPIHLPCRVITNLDRVKIDVAPRAFKNEDGLDIDIPFKMTGNGQYSGGSSTGSTGTFIDAENLLRVPIIRPSELSGLYLVNSFSFEDVKRIPVGKVYFAYDLTMYPG